MVGSVLVGFSNGVLTECSISSIEVPLGSFIGVSLARWSPGWWGGALFVPLELRWFLVVFACDGVFHLFPVIS